MVVAVTSHSTSSGTSATVGMKLTSVYHGKTVHNPVNYMCVSRSVQYTQVANVEIEETIDSRLMWCIFCNDAQVSTTHIATTAAYDLELPAIS